MKSFEQTHKAFSCFHSSAYLQRTFPLLYILDTIGMRQIDGSFLNHPRQAW